MANYQGIVDKLMAGYKVEILIAPGKQSIIGAPEVSKKVCHECTDGSTLRIEAVKQARCSGRRLGVADTAGMSC